MLWILSSSWGGDLRTRVEGSVCESVRCFGLLSTLVGDARPQKASHAAPARRRLVLGLLDERLELLVFDDFIFRVGAFCFFLVLHDLLVADVAAVVLRAVEGRVVPRESRRLFFDETNFLRLPSTRVEEAASKERRRGCRAAVAPRLLDVRAAHGDCRVSHAVRAHA